MTMMAADARRKPAAFYGKTAAVCAYGSCRSHTVAKRHTADCLGRLHISNVWLLGHEVCGRHHTKMLRHGWCTCDADKMAGGA